MESLPHERATEHGTVTRVRDAIVAFHDRYLRVVPVKQTILTVVDYATKDVRSQKGRKGADRVRALAARLSKTAEMSLTAADMVAAIALTGVGVHNIRKGQWDKKTSVPVLDAIRKSEEKTARAQQILGQSMRNRFHHKHAIDGRILAASGVGTLVFRPISHVVDIGLRASKPLTKRVVSAVDSILLRREQAGNSKYVFVGQGKPDIL